MNTLDELFNFILENDKTIVYGNLGRYTHILFDYIMKSFPTFEIQVFSNYYYVPSTPTIKVNTDSVGKCDLLIYIEPAPNMVVISYKEAARVVVFSSHLLLTDASSPSTFVSFYYSPNVRKNISNNKRLLNMQGCSVQAARGDVLKTQYDFFEIKTIGVNYPVCDININPGKPVLALYSKTFVIVDMTNTTSSLHLLLYLWDVLDYLQDNIDMVERWLICFPEKKMKHFNKFVQECRNKLACKRFKLGNVTDKAELMALTPFYQTSTIDIDTNIQVKKFCNLDYITPKNDIEAFTCSLKYNMTPLARHIYIIE